MIARIHVVRVRIICEESLKVDKMEQEEDAAKQSRRGEKILGSVEKRVIWAKEMKRWYGLF